MPPVETEADREAFFDPAEFGQVAEIQGQEIDGFFDEPTEEIDDLGPVGILSTNPTFQCSTLKVPIDLADQEPITITRDDGSIFSGKVITHEPDGFGLSLLKLEDDG